MVRNGYGAKYIWYEMVNYGTKWLWCNIHMVRNCNFVVRNGKLWYEMVMMQNSLVPATPRIFLFDIGVRYSLVPVTPRIFLFDIGVR